MNNDFLMKKRRFFLVFFFFFLFSIANVSSVINPNAVDDVFEVNSIVQYSKPCRFEGDFCSPTATCNFTAKDPEGIVRKNASGINNPSIGEFSTTINFDKIGIWTIEMNCCDGTTRGCGAATLTAEVSGSGFNNTLGFFVLILVLSGGVILLGLWKQDATVALLGTFGLYFLGLYILFEGIAGMKDSVYTWGTGLIVLGIAFYISTKAGIELIEG